MVRDLMINEGKIAPSYNKAVQACATGMGVVLDRAARTFDLPSAETADNIYVVHKERVPTGTDAAATDFSDYHAPFNSVEANEYAPLYMYEFGEEFATDAYDADAITADAAGKYVAVGTDGKWKVASGSSKYRLIGLYNDAGHMLADIEVMDAAGTNS